MTALDDLVDGLQTAQVSVFRLEGHQDYPDDELWQAQQRGEWWEQDDDLADWCTLVSSTVDRGVTWTRTRVVVEPWTPYTRWEVEQHFPWNLRAGETITLAHTETPWPIDDFWLVDDARAWMLAYGADGAMTVTEATARALPTLRSWQTHAIAHSTPLSPVAT